MAKLHQPVYGKDRGDSHSGPDDDFLSQEGYVSRADGKILSGQAENDQRLAENREAPGEKPPTPKGNVLPVEEHPEVFKQVELDPLDSTQPAQKVIDQKWKEVEEGKRDPNNPDVVLADHAKALAASRDYDGNAVEDIVKRQEKATSAFLKRMQAQTDATNAKAVKDHEKWLADQGVQTEAKVPDERKLQKEQGIRTDAKSEVKGNDPGKTAEKDRATNLTPPSMAGQGKIR